MLNKSGCDFRQNYKNFPKNSKITKFKIFDEAITVVYLTVVYLLGNDDIFA